MAEKHSLLSAVEMTANGRRLLNEYLESARLVASQRSLPWDEFRLFLEDQLYYGMNGDAKSTDKVDAESVLNVLGQLGAAPDAADRYQRLTNKDGVVQPMPIGTYRKLYRSPNEKLVAGVCGGIAEYFQVDPVLVRGAFVVCCLLTGITVFLYPILWLLLPMRPKSLVTWSGGQPVPATADNAVVKTTAGLRKGFLGKVFGFLACLVMIGCFYLPATVLLLGGMSYCLWGTFYPIMNVDGFRFAFNQLEVPGMVLAGFISILCFCLFLLVVTFMMRLHFKSTLLGKNGLVIVILGVVVCVFGVASSLAVIVAQNRVEHTANATKTFAIRADENVLTLGPDQFKLLSANVRVSRLKIRSEENLPGIVVNCQIAARGENEEKARQHVENIQLTWLDTQPLFPQIQKLGQGMHFERVAIEMVMPAQLMLKLTGTTDIPIILEGKFAQSLTFDMQASKIRLEKVICGTVKAQYEQGELAIDEGGVEKLELNIKQSALHIKSLRCQELILNNDMSAANLHQVVSERLNLNIHRGHLELRGCEGALQLKNIEGNVLLFGHVFGAKQHHVLEVQAGQLKIFMADSKLPQLKIKNQDGMIKNVIQNYESTDAVLEINVNQGHVVIAPEHPPQHKK